MCELIHRFTELVPEVLLNSLFKLNRFIVRIFSYLCKRFIVVLFLHGFGSCLTTF